MIVATEGSIKPTVPLAGRGCPFGVPEKVKGVGVEGIVLMSQAITGSSVSITVTSKLH